MTETKGTENTKNIDLVAGKVISEIINNHEDVNAFDVVRNLLKRVKEKETTQDPDVFIGYNFYTIPRDLHYLDKYFGKESKFYKEILRGSNTKGEINPKSGLVFECKVHIPEITGILPYPDINKIIGAMSREPEKIVETARKDYEKQRPKRLAEGFPEILKLSMFPSFYYYADSGAPAFGHYCKVKFSDAMPTKGVGIYLGSLKDSFLNG